MVTAFFQREFQRQSWGAIVSSGLVIGVTVVLTGIIPMAALVFSGELERFLATGISLALMSSVVLGLVLAWRSSVVGVVAFLVAEEATLLGAMATNLAQRLPATATDADLLGTIVVAIALSSLLTGAFLFALGKFQFGELIRFLPYPVIGGFLAGLGYLITDAGFRVLTNGQLGLVNLPQLLQPTMLLRWFPSLGFALVLLGVTRRRSVHYLALPGLVLGAIALFYGVLLVTRTAPATALANGWLLGPFPAGSGWQPLSLGVLMGAHWALILSQFTSMAVLMTITALSLLLVCSALELITERDINLNQELQATGLGCFIAGLLGGMVGSHAISTVLSEKMGVTSRLTGVVAALVYLGLLLFGVSFLTYFPKPVLGGLLLFIALDLLTLQLYDGWFKLPRLDYAIVLFVMAIVVFFGFLVGVAVGLIIVVLLFAFNYSQIDVTRYSLSGAQITSRHKRPLNQVRLLQAEGTQTHIMTLQGYLFFGTANRLLKQIRQRLQTPNQPPLRFVILDFHWVTGLDSSAIASFTKLKQMAANHNFQVAFTSLSTALARTLNHSQVLGPEGSPCQAFPDLDRALEWCENTILSTSQYRRPRSLPLALRLTTLLGADQPQISTLMDYLEPMQVGAGQTLFNPGDSPDRLYILESGEVSTFLTLADGTSQRQQTVNAGATLGEVEFYTQRPYAVGAIAQSATKLYGLHRPTWQILQQEQPQVATLLSDYLVQAMAHRLAIAQQEVSQMATR